MKTEQHDVSIRSVAPWSAEYPRNQWYVAAYSDEITRKPLSRWLLDRPVVLYRDDAGSPVALFDRCPHRGYPLSEGALIGNAIQCGYHGLQFGPDGTCVHIPCGGAVGREGRVASYALVERWQFIWMWAGDPALADSSLIPNLTAMSFDSPGWQCETSALLEVSANYLMPFENFLDASHITFLHAGQIDSGDVAGVPIEMETSGRRVSVTRRLCNELPGSLTGKTLGDRSTRVDRTIIAEAFVPNLCGIRTEISAVGETDPFSIVQLIIAITPRTDSSCYEFTAVARSRPNTNPDRHRDLRKLLMEDVIAMDRIQTLAAKLPQEQLVEIGLAADKGVYQARRILDRMLRQESQVRQECVDVSQ